MKIVISIGKLLQYAEPDTLAFLLGRDEHDLPRDKYVTIDEGQALQLGVVRPSRSEAEDALWC